MSLGVGVLALQGSSAPHRQAFQSIGIESREVRAADELEGLSHLILPGGESTALHRLLVLFGLWDEIPARHRRGELALFGTCAGAILLARSRAPRPPTFGLLDAEVERNAYGRQLDSFRRPLAIEEPSLELDALFIRAPRFRRVGGRVRVLAWAGEDPVLLAAPGLLAATFHPELSASAALHRHFVDMQPSMEAARASSRARSATLERAHATREDPRAEHR